MHFVDKKYFDLMDPAHIGSGFCIFSRVGRDFFNASNPQVGTTCMMVKENI